MGFIRILILLTVSINLAFSANSLLATELNIPEILRNLLGTNKSPPYLRSSVSSVGVIDDSMESGERKDIIGKDSGKVMQIEEDPSSNSDDYEHINLILPALFKIRNVMRRMEEIRPMVEMSPGSVKTEILKYPPNFLKARLTYMLNLKKQQDDLKKQQENKG